jgi:hypothetical protein
MARIVLLNATEQLAEVLLEIRTMAMSFAERVSMPAISRSLALCSS